MLTSFPISGDSGDSEVDVSDMSSENIKEPADQAKKSTPFNLNTQFDAVGKAEIKEGYFKKDEVQFAQGEIELGMIFYYCEAYKEGAQAAISYTSAYLNWVNNPWFDQDHFHVVSLTLGGFSHRLRKWFWRGQVSINMDAKEWDLNEYANYDLLFWGRYEYCKNIGVHVGLIAETGMLMDRVYPIVGADWTLSKKWKLNLVYPVNVSLEYILTKKWTLALAGRTFNSRYRIAKNEGQSKALVRYENVGAEFAIKYEDTNFTANIHGGTTLGGSLRIANRHNHHPRHYKLCPAPYVGAEAALKF